MKKPFYIDLGDEPESVRIAAIGNQAMLGKKVAFVVDAEGDDGEAKANRYIGKLQQWYPKLVVLERHKGPVANTVSVIVGLEHKDN